MTSSSTKSKRPPGRPRAPEPFISVTAGLPASLYRKLLAYSGSVGCNRSDIVRAALASYLDPLFVPRHIGPRAAPRHPTPDGARPAVA